MPWRWKLLVGAQSESGELMFGAILLRSFVQLVLGGMAGALIGFTVAILGGPSEIVQFLAAPIGGLKGILISIIPIKMILGKNFGEFRLVPIPNDQTANNS